jgi:DNA-binding NarL/FixJ family response regulator
MRVVLAVANPHVRLAVELYLANEPGIFLVAVATDATGTRALLRSVAPDALIVSCDLPDLPVEQLIAEARASGAVRAVIVLCPDEVTCAQAQAAGATATVSSWDRPQALSDAVRSERNRLRAAGLPEPRS